jgi:hypothetical protein
MDALLVQAETAGALINDRAHDRPWASTQAPDGHLWETMFNTQLNLDPG